MEWVGGSGWGSKCAERKMMPVCVCVCVSTDYQNTLKSFVCDYQWLRAKLRRIVGKERSWAPVTEDIRLESI